jgi:putative resolvase
LDKSVKLAEWTRMDRVHPQTAYQWFRQDRMPVPARLLASGTIWVDAAPTDESGRVVVDARVSWHDHRADLDRKVARVTGWATSNGRRVNEVACEAGSGMNGNRPELRRILPDPPATVIVVWHRDRLARSGVEHLESALAAAGRRVLVAGPGETAGDLVRDMIEVLTSMCARLYGRLGAGNRVIRAITAARRGDEAGAA